MDVESEPILTPGKPGDLAMILDVGQQAVEKVKCDHEQTGQLDEAGLRAIARAIGLALEMWSGAMAVDRVVLEGISRRMH